MLRKTLRKSQEISSIMLRKLRLMQKRNGFLIKKIVYAKEHRAKTLVDTTGVFFGDFLENHYF